MVPENVTVRSRWTRKIPCPRPNSCPATWSCWRPATTSRPTCGSSRSKSAQSKRRCSPANRSRWTSLRMPCPRTRRLGDRASMAFGGTLVTYGTGAGTGGCHGLGAPNSAGSRHFCRGGRSWRHRSPAAWPRWRRVDHDRRSWRVTAVMLAIGVARTSSIPALALDRGPARDADLRDRARRRRRSPKACRRLSPSPWRSACSGWRAGARSSANCPRWRPWAARPSSAPTRPAPSPATR